LAGAAILAPGCQGARIEANESSAIGSVRAILSAQFVHGSACAGSYSASLPALGARGLLSADLAASREPSKSGYRFSLTTVKGDQPNDCGEPVKDFEVRAVPEQPGTTGVRFFRATSDGIVHAATKPDFSDAKPLT
jgi:hypothetical protein